MSPLQLPAAVAARVPPAVLERARAPFPPNPYSPEKTPGAGWGEGGGDIPPAGMSCGARTRR